MFKYIKQGRSRKQIHLLCLNISDKAEVGSKQYPTGIPVAIPVTAGIRGFAGIPVPAKFRFFAGILYRDFSLNLVQQTFDKKHVKFTTYFKLKVVIFFTK